jgi:alpha-tubulin suppressor-like RCC1 family protein
VLVLRATGTVLAWGRNTYGRLGDGTTTDRWTPVPVTGLTNVTAIAAARDFSAALDAAGHVWVWGSGFSGIGGDGTTTDHLTPYQVPGLANVTQIAAGESKAIVLDSSNQVRTWGGGLLGHGVTQGLKIPTVVAGLPPIAAVAAGTDSTFAFGVDGAVYGWGNNPAGLLADGTDADALSPIVLADANGVWRTGTPVFSPAGGSTYATEQTVQITSASPGAIVRYTTTGEDPTEADPIVPAGGLLVDQNRVLKARAWKAGQGPSYVAGTTFTLQPALPTVSPGTGTYTSPRTVTIATATTGAVLRYTTDGTEPTTSSPAYGSALPISTGTTLKAKAFKTGWTDSGTRTATYTFNYGTIDSPVISPGGGTYSTDQTVSITAPTAPAGAIIRYTMTGSDPNTSSTPYTGPITVAAGLTLKARVFHPDWTPSAVASAAYAFTVATPTFTAASGTYPAGQVVAIATNTPNATIRYTLNGAAPTVNDAAILPGQALTIGNYTLKATAWRTGFTTSGTATATYEISGEVTAPQITAGDTHTLVVSRDGTIWGFGSNGWGYLGDNSTTPRSLPVRAVGVTGIKDVAAGYLHSLAVGLDGRVYSFGTNSSGQQGDGATNGYRTVPWPVPAVTNAVAVAAGQNHSLALTNTGEVFAWGANGSGQLGLGFASSTPSPTPTLIPGLSGIVGIAAGESHSLAWTTSGALYAWGNNGNGRLGDNSTTQRTSPVLITGISGVAEVAAGRYHTIARTTSGQLFTWGRNGQGQLGLGNTTDRWIPTQVTALSGVQAIGAGHNHTLASTATTTYVWGQNNSSQVGDGQAPTNRTAPFALGIVGASVQLTGGSVHSVALDASGAVWTWGGNGAGQLGNGAMPGATPSPISGEGQIFGASPPVANPSSGWYETERTVTLTSRTPGATIRYTTDGVDPTPSDAEATAAIPIAVTTTLKARAWKTGLDPSPIRTFSYAIEPSAPTIEPNGGSFDTVKAARISIGTAATLRYTTTGADPQETDPIVASGGTVLVDRSMNLKVRAWKPGVGSGAVASATFMLQAPPPTADPAGGTYGEPKTVALKGASGTRVRYTLNGTDPSETSPEYLQPVAIWESATLKSRAFRAGWSPSATRTDVYNIQAASPTTAVVARVSPAPNEAGWNNTPVRVSFLCDSTIAPESCPAPVELLTEGNNQVVTREVADLQGIPRSATATVRIDWTAPAVTIASPLGGTSTSDAQTNVTANVADTLSGGTRATCNLQSVPVIDGSVGCAMTLAKGRNVVIVQAADLAGNSRSAAVDVTRVGTPSSLRISPSRVTLMTGTESVTELRDDFDQAVVEASWTSSNPSVAEVTIDNGVPTVRALTPGTTIVGASLNGLTAESSLTVVDGVAAEGTGLLGLPEGTELWSAANFSSKPVFPARVAEATGMPDMFLLDDTGDASILRALSIAGDERWRQAVPQLRSHWPEALGDEFGGVLMVGPAERQPGTSRDYGTMVRVGRDDVGSWTYQSEFEFWSKVAQDFQGVVSVFEWNWRGSVTKAGGSTLIDMPGWLVRLDGRTGNVIARIPLPEHYLCWGGRCWVRPSILGDPMVGADGSTYLLLTPGHQQRTVEDVFEYQQYSLLLMRVLPDGTHTYRQLANSATSDIETWPDTLAASPDGRLIGFRTRTNKQNAPLWLIDESSVATVSLPSGATVENVSVSVDQVLVSYATGTGTTWTTSFELSTMANRWHAAGRLVAPRGDGGAIVRVPSTSQTQIIGPDGQLVGAGIAGDHLWGRDMWLSDGPADVSATVGAAGEVAFFDSMGGGNQSGLKRPDTCGQWRELPPPYQRLTSNVVFKVEAGGVQVPGQPYVPDLTPGQVEEFTAAAAEWNSVFSVVGSKIRLRVATPTAPPAAGERFVLVQPGHHDTFYGMAFRRPTDNPWRVVFYTSNIERFKLDYGIERYDSYFKRLSRHEIGHIIGLDDMRGVDGRLILMGDGSADSDGDPTYRTGRITCAERTGVRTMYGRR